MRNIHTVGILVVLAIAGGVHGTWTCRWMAASEVPAGKDLLRQLDDNVGVWKSGEFFKIDETTQLKNATTTARKFTSSKASGTIVVSLTSGHPGVVSVHTPDVCYVGSGYKLKSPVQRQTLSAGENGESVSFWTADFEKPASLGSDMLRVRWGWTIDGKWDAPDFPGWNYFGSRVLYKLYIVHPLPANEDLSKDDPYKKFVTDLVPALKRSIGSP